MSGALVAVALAVLAAEPTASGSREAGSASRDAAGLPSREEVARSFACPPGTVRTGAAPPAGFEVWCEKPDELPVRRRHGPTLRWYDDGALAQAGAFVLGERDGRFLEWHRNGRIARAGTYRANERVGTWSVWFESGRREEECGYERNARQGRFATWWPNGQRRTEGRYCYDLQCGTWTSWDDQGRELGKITYEEIRRTP